MNSAEVEIDDHVMIDDELVPRTSTLVSLYKGRGAGNKVVEVCCH